MKEYRLFTLVLSIAFLAFVVAGCGKQDQESAKSDQSSAQKSPDAGSTGPAATSGSPESTSPTVAPVSRESTATKTLPPEPRRAILDSGTPVKVVTSIEVSTKDHKAGDQFEASLADDIRVGDWLIAKKGAQATCVVASSDPGGRVKGVASIGVRLKRLTLADGDVIDLTTNTYTVQAKSTKKKDAMKVGIGAGAGAAIGAIAGGGKGAAIGAAVGGGAGTAAVVATHGDPARIPSETHVTFRLSAPVEVTERK